MIPDEGALKLIQAQDSYLNSLSMGLFTSNTTITAASVFSDLTAAGWMGYATVALTSWTAPTIVSGRAQKVSTITAQFTNGSGADETYYGWYVFDSSASKLIAAVNLGSQTLPAGLSVFYVPVITDKQE